MSWRGWAGGWGWPGLVQDAIPGLDYGDAIAYVESTRSWHPGSEVIHPALALFGRMWRYNPEPYAYRWLYGQLCMTLEYPQ